LSPALRGLSAWGAANARSVAAEDVGEPERLGVAGGGNDGVGTRAWPYCGRWMPTVMPAMTTSLWTSPATSRGG